MPTYQYIIGGKPYPCPRPRATRQGHIYMPPKYKKHRNMIEIMLRNQMNLQGLSTIQESTKITMIFIYPRPKAMKGETLVIKDTKPDIDNLVKTVMDALTGSKIINDDNIITSIKATKYYGPRDYAGQTEITIETPYGGDYE